MDALIYLFNLSCDDVSEIRNAEILWSLKMNNLPCRLYLLYNDRNFRMYVRTFIICEHEIFNILIFSLVVALS